MKVRELINELSKFPGDLDVDIEGYRAGLGDGVEKHDREYEPVGVEGFEDGEGNRRVVVWGKEAKPFAEETLAEKLAGCNVRLEKLIWLPGVVYSDSPGDDLEAFIEDVNDESAVFDKLPELRGVFTAIDNHEIRDREAPEEVAMALQNNKRSGFLVQVATPVLHKLGKVAGSYTSSWGHYHTDWRYAETLDEIVAEAIAYEDRMNTADKGEAA